MFSASRVPWVVMRTSSPPACMIRMACSMQPSVSMVAVVVMDCRRMGLLPPMAVLPTRTLTDFLRL